MKNYQVTVSGCDDSTSIEIPLNDAEFAIVNAVALKITAASTYGCMPRMDVSEVLPSSEGKSGDSK